MVKDLKVAGYLFIVGLLFSGIIATVNQVTSPIITKQQDEEVIRLKNEVIPADSYTTLYDSKEQADPSINKNIIAIYEALDGDNHPLGYIFDFTTNGYGGKIELLMGINTEGITTHMAVLSERETPGFGDDILTNPDHWFLTQFQDGVDVTNPQVDVVAGISVTTGGIKDGLSVVYDYFNQNLGDMND